ncbi:hydrolase 1, exosortase A system-associated [Massilia sp. KIM]|uniref:hydrolase 1, exosortase A system-associated n=1 Tax=Massilia sp. KIM TaxID=1955422 RepID=UPI00098E951D|nr:hydrolase 1, exosortase A system-associated [Massilia sp. KIM]OON59496.1 hydrolase 1, exosortase A system-associated [Massilia sp. KIM]
MNARDVAVRFACEGEDLIGVLSLPERPQRRGVLVVVGGPQYRAGSHRQFTLLARGLAEQGYATLRFDYRGMGDSGGALRSFEQVDADLRAAVDQFFTLVPTLEEVVIWGLCDGASAALFYAHQDPRVSGLVLLNPWVRTAEGLAKATLKHYYRARLLEPELWKKLLSGRFAFRSAAASLLAQLRTLLARRPDASDAGREPAGAAAAPLPERMRLGLQRFGGPALFIFSGADLTAKEFLDLVADSRDWQALLKDERVAQHHLAPADHTFSRRAWRDQVTQWTADWLRTFARAD